jgi:hypothetical protein
MMRAMKIIILVDDEKEIARLVCLVWLEGLPLPSIYFTLSHINLFSREASQNE